MAKKERELGIRDEEHVVDEEIVGRNLKEEEEEFIEKISDKKSLIKLFIAK